MRYLTAATSRHAVVYRCISRFARGIITVFDAPSVIGKRIVGTHASAAAVGCCSGRTVARGIARGTQRTIPRHAFITVIAFIGRTAGIPLDANTADLADLALGAFFVFVVAAHALSVQAQ